MAGGFTIILGRASTRLASRSQALEHNQVGRCSPFPTQPGCPKGYRGRHGSSTEGRRQENLWREFFRDPTRWGDNRNKKATHSPDFRHRKSQDGLWLSDVYKPPWVDAQLAALDMEMGRVASDRRLPDDPVSQRSAGDDRSVTAETVNKLCLEGHLTEAVEALEVLVQTNRRISNSLFYTVLKKCVVKKDLVLGSRVHDCTVVKGCQSDTFLGFHILRMYASHGRLQEARAVFEGVAKPDCFTWSAIISAHVKQGQDKQAIELYHRMRRSGAEPDGHVFVAALQACARGSDLKTGQQVHDDMLASGVEPNLFVYSCLVDMYAKCGSLEDAQRVFDSLGHKDLVTWTAMIAGYSQQGMGQEALRLYSAMLEEGIAVPDGVTFVCLLQACASVGAPALEKGKQLHAQIRDQGHANDVYVGNSLVTMYAKCGSVEDSQRVFDGLGQKNVVTWNAMIAGYSQQGMGREALRLYSAMQKEGIAEPDCVTFVCLLQACATLGNPALEKGKQLHMQIRDRGQQTDVFIANSLVNMYAKCGSLEDAQSVFEDLVQKDVVTWTAMIAAYSQQGKGHEALRLYGAMLQEGMTVPNAMTFVCLIQACANVAALYLGRQLHVEVVEQGLQGDLFVAGSLINMYGKSGSMVEAQQVFDALPGKNLVIWNALIAGYAGQGESNPVFELVQSMRQDCIQPNGITFLSILTVCSHAGLVKKGWEEFEAMRKQYGITPTEGHYTCMVDLLGRAGQLNEALALARSMPVLPDTPVWHTLLSACRKWNNVEVGRHAFNEAVKLEKKDAAAYVLMANIYTSAQMWEQAEEMQARRKRVRAWKQPGQSWWADEDGLVHIFLVGQKKHPRSQARLKQLLSKTKKEGRVQQLDSLPADMYYDRKLCSHSDKLSLAHALSFMFHSLCEKSASLCRLSRCHERNVGSTNRIFSFRDASRLHLCKAGKCS